MYKVKIRFKDHSVSVRSGFSSYERARSLAISRLFEADGADKVTVEDFENNTLFEADYEGIMERLTVVKPKEE